jgi:Polysaccharide pyruvyl transferase
MPRKIGVLTFHRCINNGSYWQARCLVGALRDRGHDAVILDHHSARVNVREWKCALRPTMPTPVPRADWPRYRRKVRAFCDAVGALPLSTAFQLENPSGINGFDTVVVGSDEVWNLQHPWYGGARVFFGTGLSADTLVSYAASFGNYDASRGMSSEFADPLRKFRAIAVRDQNSRDLLGAAVGLDVPIVLDPCLQFPREAEGPWTGPNQPFVAVYGHNFSSTFVREVQRWAAERGRVLLSISYRNDWADLQWLEAGPQDFAHVMARADAVATNFFHGCVFALLHHKPFVCETMPYREHKVRGLVAEVGAERHLVGGDADSPTFDELLGQPIAPAVDERVDRLRRRSARYLDDALG